MKNTERTTRLLAATGAFVAVAATVAAVAYGVAGTPKNASDSSATTVASASAVASPNVTASPSPSVAVSPSDTPTQAPTPTQTDAAPVAPKTTKAYTPPAPAPKTTTKKPASSYHVPGSNSSIVSIRYNSCTRPDDNTWRVNATIYFTDGPLYFTNYVGHGGGAIDVLNDGVRDYVVPDEYSNFPC